MKAIAIGALGAVLGLSAAKSLAQDAPWRQAGAPVAFERASSRSESGVTLNRPVPLSAASVPGEVTPAVHFQQAPPVFRAKVTDPEEIHRLMPLGPAPTIVVQPGAVKQGQGEPTPVPKIVDSFIAPMPQSAMPQSAMPSYSSHGDCGPAPGPIPQLGGSTIIGDCGEPGCCGQGRHFAHGGWLHNCLGCCDDGCCLPRPNTFWLRGEYLSWQMIKQSVPPLISSAPDGTDATRPLPVTNVIYGDEPFQNDNSPRSGARFSFGFWFPHLCDWGMDASFFAIMRSTSRFEAGSPGVISRLFYDELGQQESFQVVSGPYGAGLFAIGTTTVQNVTQLSGFDINLRKKLCCGPRFWLDGQIGYRYARLSDAFNINENIYPNSVDPVVGPVGTERPFQQILVNDGFRTRNQFNGFQIGLEGELRVFHRWFIGGNAKFAVGNVQQLVQINGSTTFLNTDDGAGGNIPRVDGVGGLYALVTNIGKYERNTFAFLPEFGIKLGYDLTDHLRVYAGYNFMYLSNVVRAAEQIDRRVNINYVPDANNPRPVLDPVNNGALRPAVMFRQSDFWAQGGSFGLEYHW